MGDAQLNFDLGYKTEPDIQEIIRKVQDVDVIIFAGGISPQLEGEEMGVNLPGFKGGDRTDIELPEVQRNLIEKLHQAGKKIIFVNCSGSPIGLVPETKTCEAIIQAWYPGQSGGKAVAEVLSGKINPSGKLPVTFYSSLSQLPDFENYNMTGRTYRYMQEKPLFPFGYGLSYTTFGIGKLKLKHKTINTGENLHFSLTIKNTGNQDGEEVIQVYLTKNGDKAGPAKTLRAFKRISLAAGKSAKVNFSLSPEQLSWWNPLKDQVENHAGEYTISIGRHSGDEDMKVTTVMIR
jgi:beta-glucosidase